MLNGTFFFIIPYITVGGDVVLSHKKKNPPTIRLIPLLITAMVGIDLWVIRPPEGITPQAWHLFAIFVATILGFIIKPLPMGPVAIFGIAITALTNTLSVPQALSGFGHPVIWLIVIAFFISRGFIKTGLGERIAYLFVKRFGKKTLGLAYSLLFSDLILSPAIPSNTARAGGIILPIIRSLSETFGSRPDDGTERKIGAFLVKVGFQGDLITSAMFMTAMAANPLSAKLAKDVAGVQITWTGWAIAAALPGLISLVVIPFLLYKWYPPEITETPNASAMANEKLTQMGPLKRTELLMLFVFLIVLVLWIFGNRLGVDPTTTAFIGLAILLLTEVLSWEDVLKERGAWDTLTWFAAVVMMATYLDKLGLIAWFGNWVKHSVSGLPWILSSLILLLIYFYSHYFFASSTAHISAMFTAFLVVMVAAGAPPMIAALLLAFFSNLFAATTHYGAGTSPVFFGTGYVSQPKWWSLGFLVSVVNIIIWLAIGGVWWKILGLW